LGIGSVRIQTRGNESRASSLFVILNILVVLILEGLLVQNVLILDVLAVRTVRPLDIATGCF
jgi:hypothetical protein